MNTTRIIFERGLEVSPARNSVKLATDGLTLVQTYAEVLERYGVRPVLLTQAMPAFGDTMQEHHSVLTLDGLDLLGLRVPSLVPRQGMAGSEYADLFHQAMNVEYMAGALLYHCQQLALHCFSHLQQRGRNPGDDAHGGRPLHLWRPQRAVLRS